MYKMIGLTFIQVCRWDPLLIDIINKSEYVCYTNYTQTYKTINKVNFKNYFADQKSHNDFAR